MTHFLAGWLIANAADLDRRGRALVTVAGVIPDLDGLGIVAEVATRNSNHPLTWWSDYHHVLGHNIGFCALVTLFGVFLARRRFAVAILTSRNDIAADGSWICGRTQEAFSTIRLGVEGLIGPLRIMAKTSMGIAA